MKNKIVFIIKCFFACFMICNAFFVSADFESDCTYKRTRTFLQTKPVYMNIARHNHLALQYVYQKRSNLELTCSFTPFHYQSFLNSTTQNYFLPKHKSHITIVGDQAAPDAVKKRDVRAEWLNLPSSAQATLQLVPQYKVTGFAVHVNKNLKDVVPTDFFSSLQCELVLPFVIAEHFLFLDEQNLSGVPPGQIIDAFSNTVWIGQRIKQYQSSVGLSDVAVSISSSSYCKDHYIFAAHSGLVLPTAPKNSHTYLFSPARGNNGRFAFYGGVDMQFALNEAARIWNMLLFASIESYYFFATDVYRTFDLKQKPWSRFLPYIDNNQVQPNKLQGVNVLTLRAHLKPQAYVDFSCGIRLVSDYIHFEVGYGVWGHDSERIEHLDTSFNNLIGIAGVQQGASASKSTIGTQATDDEQFIPVKLSDIDLISGSALSALNHIFHASVGITKKGSRIDGFIGFGGSVEKAQLEGSMTQWGAWVKIGATV